MVVTLVNGQTFLDQGGKSLGFQLRINWRLKSWLVAVLKFSNATFEFDDL